MKKYYYDNGSHKFDKKGKYLGFFDKFGASQGIYGKPFTEWENWSKDKHIFLVDELGFMFVEN